MQRIDMRLLMFLAATVATAAGQGGNFSGTAFDLETGRTQVISGTIEEPDRAHNERMATYRRINAELETSINSMRQESQLREQTYEMQKQTRLLEDMAEKAANQPSLPPTVIVNRTVEYAAPEPIYTIEAEPGSAPPIVESGGGLDAAYAERFREDMLRKKDQMDEFSSILTAKSGRNFGRSGQEPARERMTVSGFSTLDKNSNEQLIKGAIQGYKGNFTNYRWRGERIDEQTYLVICEVTLDGQEHDFKFEVNSQLQTCMYVGGTAFERLKPTATLSLWPPW